jgi:SAM-dependent methyltransferase
MTDDAALHGYYARGLEADRLLSPLGQLEFERTKELISRHLPSAPAMVADIGAGPGRYARWLADLGHSVTARDLVPLHIEQLVALDPDGRIDARLGDARSLDLHDASHDAVLLLGPLYHLVDRADRVRCLTEAARVVRPGGPVFASAISRWSPRLGWALGAKGYEAMPELLPLLPEVERTGEMPVVYEGSFSGYTHRPEDLLGEALDAGLVSAAVYAVEGAGNFMPDLAERMADPVGREVVFDAARATEQVAELIGIGNHLLLAARRAASPPPLSPAH